MKNIDLIDRLSAIDAFAPGTQLPEQTWTPEVALTEIERRMGMDPTDTTVEKKAAGASQEDVLLAGQVDTDEPKELRVRRKRRSRGLLVAAVAAVVVLVAGFGTWIAIDDSPDPVADPAAISRAWIDAFNDGDTERALGLLTPDASLSEFYTGMSSEFDIIDPAFHEQQLAWETAQGSTLVGPECLVTGDAPEAGTMVVCEFGWHPIVEQAIGDTPIPTVLTLVVTEDGIHSMAFEYPPEFQPAGFEQWLRINHAEDVQKVTYGDWSSVAEAREGGLLRAQYAQEWAAFLETSG